MKKAIILGSIFSLSVFLFSGCGAGPSPESHTGLIENQYLTQKKVHKLIKKAGEDANWVMTEFKSNAIIAEKFGNGDAEAVTITFTNSSYDIYPENRELSRAIDSALN